MSSDNNQIRKNYSTSDLGATNETGMVTQDTIRKPTFKLKEVLGSGGAGVVYRASTSRRYLYSNNDEVAIKTMKLSAMTKREHKFLAREIAIHRAVKDHPHICRFYNHFSDKSHVYMIMEVLKGGDVLTLLKRSESGFCEQLALNIISQVLSAIAYLHDKGIAHRDIKPENIVLVESCDPTTTRNAQVKLIDFGLVTYRKLGSNRNERLSSEKVGTLRYAAPEIMRDQPYLPEETDIWSAGIVLFTMISRRNPYLGNNDAELLQSIQDDKVPFSGEEWKGVSLETILIIKKMLHLDGKQRPSAKLCFQLVQAQLDKIRSNQTTPLHGAYHYKDGDLLFPVGRKQSMQGDISDLVDSNGTDGDESAEEDDDSDSIFSKIKSLLLSFANFGSNSESQATESEETENSS